MNSLCLEVIQKQEMENLESSPLLFYQKRDFSSTSFNDEEFKREIQDQKIKKTERIKFGCKIENCAKSYTSRSNLNTHMKKHTGSKLYKCEFKNCGKLYPNMCRLKVHTRLHTGEKPFKCVICIKSFNERGNLKTHVRIHSGDKPFRCDYLGCNQSFKAKGQLTDHIRSHNGIRNFKCNLCSKSFCRSGTLKAHIKTHTKMFPCKFEKCFRSFNRKDLLDSHLKKFHQNTTIEKISKMTTDFNTKQKIYEDANFFAAGKDNFSPIMAPNEIIFKVHDFLVEDLPLLTSEDIMNVPESDLNHRFLNLRYDNHTITETESDYSIIDNDNCKN